MGEAEIKMMLGNITILNIWILIIALAAVRHELLKEFMKNKQKEDKKDGNSDD